MRWSGRCSSSRGSRAGAWFVCLTAVLLLAACSRRHEHPNVVLIVVDALRPDFLSCYGYERPTSPEIDDLARNGIVFENAVTHAPWTKTSFSTFLTSLYPFEHGVLDWESVLPDSVSTLPQVLGNAGYSTMAVINMLGIAGEFKVTRGFEKVSEAGKRDRDALTTSDDAIALIKGARKPFFILIHYFDTHWPYRPPPEDLDLILKPGDADPLATRMPTAQGERAGKSPEQDIDRDRLLYAGCIRHVDRGVGKLVKYLDEAGLKRDTVVIVTADHGEAFREHGVTGHGRNLYDEAIRVPLIIVYPDRHSRPLRLTEQARHIDLLPTILDLARVPDTRRREGASLLPIIETGKRAPGPSRCVPPDVALCECSLKKAPDFRCLRSNDLKLIVEPVTRSCELYDLQADPGERVDLWSRRGAVADSFSRMIDRIPGTNMTGWRVAFSGKPPTKEDVEVSLPNGSRLIGVDEVTTQGDLRVEVAPDSASFTIHGRPAGPQILLFDVEPKDARITFRVISGANGALQVNVGKAGVQRVGKRFTVGPQEATAPPDGFEQARATASPGVYIWWLPGGGMRRPGERVRLTSEAKRRLRALGYAQ